MQEIVTSVMLGQRHTGWRQVDISSVETHTDQRHTGLRQVDISSMEARTGPTSHWVEDSVRRTQTRPTSHWVEVIDNRHWGIFMDRRPH